MLLFFKTYFFCMIDTQVDAINILKTQEMFSENESSYKHTGLWRKVQVMAITGALAIFQRSSLLKV